MTVVKEFQDHRPGSSESLNTHPETSPKRERGRSARGLDYNERETGRNEHLSQSYNIAIQRDSPSLTRRAGMRLATPLTRD
jgi:hypothetical protein